MNLLELVNREGIREAIGTIQELPIGSHSCKPKANRCVFEEKFCRVVASRKATVPMAAMALVCIYMKTHPSRRPSDLATVAVSH